MSHDCPQDTHSPNDGRNLTSTGSHGFISDNGIDNNWCGVNVKGESWKFVATEHDLSP